MTKSEGRQTYLDREQDGRPKSAFAGITKAHAWEADYFGAEKHCESASNPCNLAVSRALSRANFPAQVKPVREMEFKILYAGKGRANSKAR
jgi:hypothetical protein